MNTRFEIGDRVRFIGPVGSDSDRLSRGDITTVQGIQFMDGKESITTPEMRAVGQWPRRWDPVSYFDGPWSEGDVLPPLPERHYKPCKAQVGDIVTMEGQCYKVTEVERGQTVYEPYEGAES